MHQTSKLSVEPVILIFWDGLAHQAEDDNFEQTINVRTHIQSFYRVYRTCDVCRRGLRSSKQITRSEFPQSASCLKQRQDKLSEPVINNINPSSGSVPLHLDPIFLLLMSHRTRQIVEPRCWLIQFSIQKCWQIKRQHLIYRGVSNPRHEATVHPRLIGFADLESVPLIQRWSTTFRWVTRTLGESQQNQCSGPISYRLTREIKNDAGGESIQRDLELWLERRRRNAAPSLCVCEWRSLNGREEAKDAAAEPCGHEQRRGRWMIDRWVSGVQRGSTKALWFHRTGPREWKARKRANVFLPLSFLHVKA